MKSRYRALAAAWCAAVSSASASFHFQWSGPTTVTPGTPYTVGVTTNFTPSIQNDPGFYVNLLRNGSAAGAGSGSPTVPANVQASFTDTVGQTLQFTADAHSYLGEHGIGYRSVVVPNQLPVATVTAPKWVRVGSTFSVAVSASDPDSNLDDVSVRRQGVGTVQWWNVDGQGSVTKSTDIVAPSTPTTINFRGEAIDLAGAGHASDWATVSIIADVAPTASISGPTAIIAGQTGQWTISTSDTDGNLQEWRLSVVPSQAQWSPVSGNSQSVTFPHMFPAVGTYTFRLEVKDSMGKTASRDYVVQVSGGDSDGDGMPDHWESLAGVGLNPNNPSDGMTDVDGDGLTNVAEFNLNRNPRVVDAGESAMGNAIPAGWPNTAAVNAAVVGTTAGSLSVDKAGAATYSIPIWVSPGTAGMEPKLSLNYSSQAGPGLAGLGWSIGGTSLITRGPQTRSIDGQVKGVSLTANDRFYLDGQRLIATSGAYGANGTEYRTELETFTKVVSNGSAGSGPASFKAWTKAGLIIEFGVTTDSALDAGALPEKLWWAINRITDTSGNYLKFTYQEDATNGTHLLTRIDYTGNDTAALAPFASVRFEYEDRLDWASGYMAGVPVAAKKRLKNIKSYVGSTVVRTYALRYETRGLAERSLLVGLTETGSDAKSYPELVFGYEASTAGWEGPSTWKPGADYMPKHFLADNQTEKPTGAGFVDLNGDGLVDMVVRQDASPNEAYLNDGTTWVSFPSYRVGFPLGSASNTHDQGSRFVDLNGDGLPDFVWRRMNSSGGNVGTGAWINTGSGWTSSTPWHLPAPLAKDNESLRSGRFLDVDGDGRMDFVAMLTSTGGTGIDLGVYRNSGTGWAHHSGYSTLPVATNLATARARFIDINGDGLVDIVANYEGSGGPIRRTFVNTGAGWQDAPTYYLQHPIASDQHGSMGSEFVDVNADGLPDHVWYRENTTATRGVAINTGKGWLKPAAGTDLYLRFAPPAPLSRDGQSGSGVAIIDVNADGMPDLAMNRQFSGDSAAVDTWIGTGRQWVHDATGQYDLPTSLLTPTVKNSGVDFVDFDGNGAVDLVRRCRTASGTNLESAWRNKAKAADVLSSVTNGFGVDVRLTYKVLTDSTVYTKGTGSAFPVADLVGPHRVVAQVSHDDGVGGRYPITYSYGGLRAHAERGSLGFSWTRSVDGRTGIESLTTYSQTYPYIGMPVASSTRQGTVTLNETAVAYENKSPLNGNVRFVLAAETIVTTRDLNNDITSLTTTYVPSIATDVDDYGNIKKLVVESGAVGSKHVKTTVSIFSNDTTQWFLGRLSSAVVTSTAPGVPNVTRESSFKYSPTTGLLTEETVEPNAGSDPGDVDKPEIMSLKLTTTYTHDSFGNREKVTLSGHGVTSRATTTKYTANGRFPDYSENALGHRETYGYNANLGVLTSVTGPNKLATTWEHDGFGRVKKEARADGTSSETRLKWPAAGPLVPAGALYLVETESTGAPPTLAFHDRFARPVRTVSIMGSGEDQAEGVNANWLTPR